LVEQAWTKWANCGAMKRLKSAGRKRVGAKRPYALIGRNPDGLKGRDVSELAWELGLSRATTYRMIRLFRAGGTVASLMDRTRGRRCCAALECEIAWVRTEHCI